MRRENARAGYHKENPHLHLRTRCVSASPLLSSQQDALSSLETSICPLEREEVHCHCSGAALAALASWGRCQLCRSLSCSCWLSRCRALCAQGKAVMATQEHGTSMGCPSLHSTDVQLPGCLLEPLLRRANTLFWGYFPWEESPKTASASQGRGSWGIF